MSELSPGTSARHASVMMDSTDFSSNKYLYAYIGN